MTTTTCPVCSFDHLWLTSLTLMTAFLTDSWSVAVMYLNDKWQNSVRNVEG